MRIDPSSIQTWSVGALDELKRNGVVRLPWTWPPSHVEEFTRYLKQRPVYTGHVVHAAEGDQVPRRWDEAQDYELLCYRMDDPVSAPHFFEFAIQFTGFAAQYLGAAPRMYSFNAFWTRPGKDPINPNIQQWHCDRDDERFLAMFMYGTDIFNEEQGPHLFARGSHHDRERKNRPPGESEVVDRIYGPAGSFFFADTSGSHMGVKPRAGERLLAWARWGIGNPPPAYLWDKLQPVPRRKLRLSRPVGPEVRQSTSLVVDWTDTSNLASVLRGGVSRLLNRGGGAEAR